MRWLLQCDLFRVVQDKDKHLTPPNPYGASMTIVMYVTLCVLFLGEFSNYFRGHSQCSLAPSARLANMTSSEVEDLRQVKAVVTFPYIPCHRLMSEMHDEEWRMPPEVAGKLVLRRFATPAGVFEASTEGVTPYADGQMDAEEMGCTVDVRAPLPSIPVRFNIVVAGYDPRKQPHYRSDHAIHEFRLGGQDVSGLVPQVTRDTTEPLSHTRRTLEKPSSFGYCFLFHVQYLRTQVFRPKMPPVSGFQYAAQESSFRNTGQGTAPGVYMLLFPSPYSIHCTVEYDTIRHFLVHLCAVVGGVYTVFGFLELAVETLARHQRRNERAHQNALNTEKSQKQQLVDRYLGTLSL